MTIIATNSDLMPRQSFTVQDPQFTSLPITLSRNLRELTTHPLTKFQRHWTIGPAKLLMI